MPIFRVDENIILEQNARYEGGGGIKIYGRKKGKLFLTNKRIIFEYEERLISKKIFVPLDELISNIRNVGGEGLILKKLVIELDRSGGERGYGRTGRVEFYTNDVAEWVREIQMLIAEIR